MATHLLNAGKAAWVDQGNPSRTFYDRPGLQLDGVGSDRKRAFLWFPNPIGRQGDAVLSGVLTVYLAGAWAGTTTITASRITQSWRQDGVKWGASGAAPSVTSVNAGTATVTNGVAGDAVPIDVTALLRDVQDGAPWYGLRLTVDGDGPLRLWSPKAPTASKRPTLLVSLSITPDAPDGLHPDGEGYALSDAVPLFRWDFGSSDANAYQASSRIQVTETQGSYDALAYDSGWVANDQTSYDPSLDADPPTFSDDTTFYWRVAIRDQNGLESDWSDEATFARASTGDLLITYPESDGDPVPDNTPAVAWYTDAFRQAYVRARVYDSPDGVTLGTLLYTRGWEAQQQDVDENGDPVGYDDWTIPADVPTRKGTGDAIISTPGNFYAVVIDVRDDQTRPDGDYLSDTRFFQFVPATDTPPAALTLTSPASAPYVSLTWTRGATPDFWVVTRDGKRIAELDGPDLLVSGSTYAWTDWTAKPGGTYSYNVRAKTAGVGVGSAVASPLSVTVKPVGLWLLDPEAGTAVCLLDNADVSQALAETSASLTPLNRRDAVRIVSRIGGYEGTLSGTIAEWLGVPAATALAALEDTVGRRSTEHLRLVFGARNIPVNVGQLVVSQRPAPSGNAAMFDVSFSWWQIGGYSVAVN